METLTVQNCPPTSLSSGQAANLHITVGFATTPPPLSEPEAGLRCRPRAQDRPASDAGPVLRILEESPWEFRSKRSSLYVGKPL